MTQDERDTQENISLEEAVFGEGYDDNDGSQTISDVFNTEINSEEAPEDSGQPSFKETQEVGNDEKRYQYWQSEADKYKNELEKYKGMEQQINQMMAAQQQAPAQQAAPPEAPPEEFPPPPIRPDRPRDYNREDAFTDPSSNSARYQDELEQWRDDMDEYNQYKSDYQSAVVQERLDMYEQNRVEEIQRNEAAQKQAEQRQGIYNEITSKHGMNDSEANDFIAKMSDPSSINIDNLVQLYRMQQGAARTQGTPPASQDFRQTQNAQQVPSPMGVMPSGQSNQDSRSAEDKIMDSMIGNFNSKNPWT